MKSSAASVATSIVAMLVWTGGAAALHGRFDLRFVADMVAIALIVGLSVLTTLLVRQGRRTALDLERLERAALPDWLTDIAQSATRSGVLNVLKEWGVPTRRVGMGKRVAAQEEPGVWRGPAEGSADGRRLGPSAGRVGRTDGHRHAWRSASKNVGGRELRSFGRQPPPQLRRRLLLPLAPQLRDWPLSDGGLCVFRGRGFCACKRQLSAMPGHCDQLFSGHSSPPQGFGFAGGEPFTHSTHSSPPQGDQIPQPGGSPRWRGTFLCGVAESDPCKSVVGGYNCMDDREAGSC